MFKQWKREVKDFLAQPDLSDRDLGNAITEAVSVCKMLTDVQTFRWKNADQSSTSFSSASSVAEEKTSSESEKPSFQESTHCQSRLHCVACRTRQGFRDSIRQHFEVPENFDEECPFGVTAAEASKSNEEEIEKEESEEDEEDEEEDLPEPELPSLTDQARNFTKAMGKAAISALAGKQLKVSKQEFQKRISVCKGCLLYIQSKKRCSHPKCGCFIEKKAWLTTEECPAGFWKQPEKQQKFNKERMKQLRAMQNNVVSLQDFVEHREELAAVISKNSPLRKAYKAYDKKKNSKHGCKGCAVSRLQRRFLQALLEEWQQGDAEHRNVLRGILGSKEYIMDGNTPVTWDELNRAEEQNK